MDKIGIAIIIIGCIIVFISSLPKEEEERLWLQCSTVKTSDSTHTINAMVVKMGDSKIYGRKQFEYKTRNVDYIVSYQKVQKEIWDWYAEIYLSEE